MRLKRHKVSGLNCKINTVNFEGFDKEQCVELAIETDVKTLLPASIVDQSSSLCLLRPARQILSFDAQ